MKVFSFFLQLFSAFVYLTLGSLILIVSLHIASLEDTVDSISRIYHSVDRSFQLSLLGFLFIVLGLAFARLLVKKTRLADSFLIEDDRGKVSVAVGAIQEIVEKGIRKFLIIKNFKIKTVVEEDLLVIKIRLSLWAGMSIPELVKQLREELEEKILKVLGENQRFVIDVEVGKVEEHEEAPEVLERV